MLAASILFLFFILLFNKPKKNVLNCGIFGFVGIDKPNISSIKLLGLYNLPRGKDSCGIYINEELTHGVGKEKEWPKLIETYVIPQAGDNRIVLGHTRAATVGAHTEKNAHPFIINDNMVMVHNGTIRNIDQLVHKYGVDVTGIEVDSQKLGKIIDECGYDVLNNYVGYAALMWTYKDQPNKLYCYRGVSRNYHAGAIMEERPLYCLYQEGGYYFSSLPESLEAIKISESQRVRNVEPNKVFCMDCTGEKLRIQTLYEVQREDQNISVSYYENYGRSGFGYAGGRTQNKQTATVTGAVDKKPITHLERSTPIIFAFGRYRHDSCPLHGLFYLSEIGNAMTTPPANSGNLWKPYYFYYGVMIRSHEAYQNLMRNGAAKMQMAAYPNKFAKIISYFSMYPVPVIATETDDSDILHTWFWDGQVYPYLNFNPLGCYVEYFITGGQTTSTRACTLNKGLTSHQVWTSPDEDTVIPPNGTCAFDLRYLTEVAAKRELNNTTYGAAMVRVIEEFLTARGAKMREGELISEMQEAIHQMVKTGQSPRQYVVSSFAGVREDELEEKLQEFVEEAIEKENGGSSAGKSEIIKANDPAKNTETKSGESKENASSDLDEEGYNDALIEKTAAMMSDILSERGLESIYDVDEDEDDFLPKKEKDEDEFLKCANRIILGIDDLYIDIEDINALDLPQARAVIDIVFSKVTLMATTFAEALEERGYQVLAGKVRDIIAQYTEENV